MPINVGYQPIPRPGAIDLASIDQRQRALQQQKQQQQSADWQRVMQVFQTLMTEKKQKEQQEKMLQNLGVVSEVPEKATFTPEVLSKYQNAMQMFSPGAQEQLKGFAREGVQYPTGRTRTQYDFGKVPPGMEFMMGGMKFKGQQPSLFQNLTMTPEGEPALNVGGSIIPISKLTKTGFSVAKEQDNLKLWKQAENEVVTALGGASMVGLDEESRSQYYPAIYNRYTQLKEQFGKGKIPATNIEQKSPYKEYPDAFLENGVWKVIRNGKKYKIEGD